VRRSPGIVPDLSNLGLCGAAQPVAVQELSRQQRRMLARVEAHTPLLRSVHRAQNQAGIVTPRLREDGQPVMKNGRHVMIAKFS
jgi:hypothetical protein